MKISRAKLLCKSFAKRDARRRADLIRDIRTAMGDGKAAEAIVKALDS